MYYKCNVVMQSRNTKLFSIFRALALDRLIVTLRRGDKYIAGVAKSTMLLLL